MIADLGIGHVRLSFPGNYAVARSGGLYGEPGGCRTLRAAIADFEKVSAEEVVVTTGASMGLTSLLAGLPRPCSVMLPRPYYPAYPRMAELLGLQVIYYGLREECNWMPDPVEILGLVRGNTQAIVLNSPGNPTGSLIEVAVLAELTKIINAADLLVISDEVYGEFVYPEAGLSLSVPDLPEVQRLARVRSFSKSFGMPGERLGYVLTRADLRAQVERVHWTLAMSPPATAQQAALAALRNSPQLHISRLRDELNTNRLAAGEIMKGGHSFTTSVPAAGIFYWIKVPASGFDSRTLAKQCAERASVIVAPGDDFGMASPAYLRASFALPLAEVQEGFTKLKNFLDNLESLG